MTSASCRFPRPFSAWRGQHIDHRAFRSPCGSSA
jgi:hypothetical protein